MLIPETVASISLERGSVVTVGSFDGVHLGHRKILSQAAGVSRARQLPAVAVTFDPMPREVLGSSSPVILTTILERAALIEETGITRLVVIPFTEEFARLSAEEFVRSVLVNKLSVREVVIGYNHSFGYERRGNPGVLKTLGAAFGFGVHIVEPHHSENRVISSTRIRTAIVEGDVQDATHLLGRPYVVSGRVVRGDGRGRSLGFPTANLIPEDERKIVPRQGVYAVRVRRQGQSERFDGMMNIGTRPTVTPHGDQVVEVHLLDFEGDLYGEVLGVSFIGRLREEVAFDSLDALIEQLDGDRQHCRTILNALS